MTGDPLWYKDAVIYELYVRTFQDSNGDGTGDFRGLASRLDYLSNLGVTCVWLLPFYPSPMKDGGYDIADYMAVHPDFGSMTDFRRFVRAAHERGIRVITELVINHTSDQHPWFQKARQAPRGSAAREMYVWTDDPTAYGGTRVIFTDTESSNWAWDPIAGQYYWHRFFSHQPDLNFASPRVREAVKRIMKFWLDAGVDGLRLDAVPYLCEREGTNNENLPETHEVLRELRAYVDEHYEDRMLLAEANQWPEDVIAYFGDGDECHMAFNFPVMPRMFMALRQEDRHPITDILQQTPAIPDSCQWGLFLRNHDELTLEMVTDEERDYMYSVYAADPRMRVNVGIRRRLAPLMQGNRRAIELLNSLLFALPGTPILYYGDELGMGDNVFLGDRDGVRTPMQWTGDRNAGFSSADPARLYLPVIADPLYGYQAVNVEAQERTPSSFLNWMRRLAALRRDRHVFGRGTIEMLHPENRRVLAFIRRYEQETVLVVANISRFVQPVELDLSEFAGLTPIEMLGRTPFPVIDDGAYRLALGPHAFYWFDLRPQPEVVTMPGIGALSDGATMRIDGEWAEIASTSNLRALEERFLPAFLPQQRWFGGKERRIRSTRIRDVAPLLDGSAPAWSMLVDVTYADRGSETYYIPLAVATGRAGRALLETSPSVVVAHLEGPHSRALLVDAMTSDTVCLALLRAMSSGASVPARAGRIHAVRERVLPLLTESLDAPPAVRRSNVEQSNTSVRLDDQLMLKAIRRIEQGPHPEVEIARHLAAAGFDRSPRLGASLSWESDDGEPAVIAMLQEFVWNQGDGWSHTLREIKRYLEEVTADPALAASIDDRAITADSGYQEMARILGVRTAQMHVALGRGLGHEAFEPAPFARSELTHIVERIAQRLRETVAVLQPRQGDLAPGEQESLAVLVAATRGIAGKLRRLAAGSDRVQGIRVHGDFHLGQVLWSRNDFFIVDFEGEVGLPLAERRARGCALTDVAGMLRSFEYAAQVGLRAYRESLPAGSDLGESEQSAASWVNGASRGFLDGYRAEVGDALFVPREGGQFQRWLNLFTLDKALHELEYEISHRPEWVAIPLHGVARLLRDLK